MTHWSFAASECCACAKARRFKLADKTVAYTCYGINQQNIDFKFLQAECIVLMCYKPPPLIFFNTANSK